jgi:hypothetical protein
LNKMAECMLSHLNRVFKGCLSSTSSTFLWLPEWSGSLVLRRVLCYPAMCTALRCM